MHPYTCAFISIHSCIHAHTHLFKYLNAHAFDKYIYVCVCGSACMHVCLSVCMHACMYYVWICMDMYLPIYVSTNLCSYASMYLILCIYVSMFYVSMCLFLFYFYYKSVLFLLYVYPISMYHASTYWFESDRNDILLLVPPACTGSPPGSCQAPRCIRPGHRRSKGDLRGWFFNPSYFW